MFTNNFTVYVVPTNSETLQIKVTGLLPVSTYILSLSITNSSLVTDNDSIFVKINSEHQVWKSDYLKTLVSSDEALRISRISTAVTLAVIVLVFIALMIFFARRDVPFNRVAYLFIFPALFALVLLEIYPIIYGIILSFTSYTLKRGEIPEFNWLQNYIEVSENPQLPIAFTTTLVWTTLIILAKIVLGFIIAYIIQYKVKRKKLWYLMIYLPWAIPSYIKILSWRTFIHGNTGYSFFNFLFGTNVNLVSQPYVTLIVACFVEVWDSIPLITTLFLGGLSSIPSQVNDLAEIDQINERTRIRRIIVPLIKPIILPAIILEIIKTFGSFNVAYLLTNGYPLLSYGTSEAGVIGATDLFSTFTFYMFYEQRQIGIAAAYSTIMSLLTLFFVIVWIKMSRGTQSAYRPVREKLPRRTGILIPILTALQGVGYLLSGIMGFRYFGIHWNLPLNYMLATFYFVITFLLIRIKNRSYKVLKLILILDLIFSASQFFVLQMWYAFNWNVIIVFLQLFILSTVKVKRNSSSKISLFQSIRIKWRSIIDWLRSFSLKIDNILTDLGSLHFVILIQSLFLLISNVIVDPSVLIWIIFSLFSITLISSLFIELVTKISIFIQPILWIGLVFEWAPIGWKIVHVVLSIVFFINYSKNYVNRFKEKNANHFLKKTLSFLSYPKNNSILLLLIILITFVPVWNILWIAFSSGNQIVPTSFFPQNPTLDNFRLLFTEEEILRHFGNSLMVSLGSATICILVTTFAAYAFSRYAVKGKNEIMVGVFVLKMFTGILTLIPFYLIMFNLGLINTYIGVILAYSTHTIPLGLWIIKGYMDSIPKELDDSALVMGNKNRRILRKIILPLAGPAIAIAFLLNFLRAWNGFLLSFVLLQSSDRYTLPIKLFSLVGSIEASLPEWGMFAAASILVIIPLLIVFFFLRNYLLKGLDSSMDLREV
jgi:arabinogalactan oligomer/maltooligosaccharide transport system permease protein